MKYIDKGSEPADFTQWKATGNWTYADLQGTCKRSVKSALILEQGGLCCYCEGRIQLSSAHIEHFQPKHDPLVDDLDYDNLLCSCIRARVRGAPLHCGHLKDDWFDPNLLVSPLQIDCETRFTYTYRGEIKPALGDLGAKKTIEKLGLDLGILNAQREAAIAPFLDPDLSEDDIAVLVTDHLSLTQGQYGPFATSIRYLFGQSTGTQGN